MLKATQDSNISPRGENAESGTQPPHEASQDSKNANPSNENSGNSGETKPRWHEKFHLKRRTNTSSSQTQASGNLKPSTASLADLRIDSSGQNKDRDSSQVVVVEKHPDLDMPTSFNDVQASPTVDSPQLEGQGSEQSGSIFRPTAHSPLTQSEAFGGPPISQPLAQHFEQSHYSPVDGAQTSDRPYQQHPLPIRGSPTHPEGLGGNPDSQTPLQDSDQTPLDDGLYPERQGLLHFIELTPPSPNPFGGEQNSDLQPRQSPPTIPSPLGNTQKLEHQSQQYTPTGSSPPKSEQMLPTPGQQKITTYYPLRSAIPDLEPSSRHQSDQTFHSPLGYVQDPEVSRQDSTPEEYRRLGGEHAELPTR